MAGTSHATTEPTWGTALGVTQTDGTVTWEMDGNSGDEYSRTAPLRVRVQELHSGSGILRCVLRPKGLLDQLEEDRAIAKYTQLSSDTNTVKTLITAVCNASTNLSSAYNGYTVITVVYDSEDSLIDSVKPADYFTININENRWDKLKELLAYTRCKGRFENDGKLHIFVPRTSGKTWVANTAYVANDYAQPVTPNNNFTYQCTTAGTSAATEPTWPTTNGNTVTDGTVVWTARTFHYEYKFNVSDSHNFWGKTIRLRFINPNKVVVRTPTDYTTQYTGNATSATSNALTEKTRTVYGRFTSNAECASIAAAMIEQYELDDERGIASVPINVGQELWDYVKITDSREDDIRIGNVQFIQRSVEIHSGRQPLTWTMTISFGKVSTQSLWATGAGVAETGLTIAHLEVMLNSTVDLLDYTIERYNEIILRLDDRLDTLELNETVAQPRKLQLNVARYVRPGWHGQAVGSYAPVANRVYYTPIYVSESTAYTKIGVEVRTLASGATVELAIYNWRAGLPSTLVLNAGTVSTTTTGTKTIAITQTLGRGYYFLAFRCSSATPKLEGISILNAAISPVQGFAIVSETGTTEPLYTILYVDGTMDDPAAAPTGATESYYAAVFLEENG